MERIIGYILVWVFVALILPIGLTIFTFWDLNLVDLSNWSEDGRAILGIWAIAIAIYTVNIAIDE